MKILNLHGLNGSNTNTNFKLLNSIYESDSNVIIESPQIDNPIKLYLIKL